MGVSRRGFFGGLAAALLAGFGLAPRARRRPPSAETYLGRLRTFRAGNAVVVSGTTPEQAFLNQILACRRGELAVPPGWWLETPKRGGR
jgi:hypothetical protein